MIYSVPDDISRIVKKILLLLCALGIEDFV